MDAAEEFIHVAVMDYAPQTMFTKRPQFWYATYAEIVIIWALGCVTVPSKLTEEKTCYHAT